MDAYPNILVEHVIALNIVQRRRACELSREDLAAAVGLLPSELFMIESGTHPELARHLKVIADQLDCTVDDFYQNTDELNYKNKETSQDAIK